MSKAILSPLRYPGSKSKVLKRLKPYFVEHKEYREPFAGSGAIFFGKPKADINWLNDKDENVANLLMSIRDNPEQLCEMIMEHHPSVSLWKHLKQYTPQNYIESAFRFLFLNRTNYSGIIKANPIGGIGQNSQYKIDCRWNPEELCRRIHSCSRKLQETNITSTDYSEIIQADGNDVLMIIDPPYYVKGKDLYSVFMSPQEHKNLSEMLRYSNHKFLLTIDDCEEVRKLYSWANFINQEQWYYSISSIANNRGKELFISNFDIKSNMEYPSTLFDL